MLERLHDHINNELNAGARTDTIYVLTAVVFNFVMLGINSAVAGEASQNVTAMVVIVITIVFSLLVNGVAVIGLLLGRQTRQKLLRGLTRMYEDSGVGKYYDPTLLGNYNHRYTVFVVIIALLGIMAILIPLVIIITELSHKVIRGVSGE